MNSKCFIIAEAGVNHNGDVDTAKSLVDIAKESGADAVKFQTFNADRLTTTRALKCNYQMSQNSDEASQIDMLKRLELDDEMHRAIIEHCANRDIEFMSTGFDVESLTYLTNEVGIKRIKIPSGEMVNPFLLLSAARSGLPIIISTGLATLKEVELSLAVVAYGMVNADGIPTELEARDALSSNEGQQLLSENVTALHCVSDYPAAFADINLKSMKTMQDAFNLPVGLSDHSNGIAISIASAALGASVIEKHFTLDKSLDGPDHKASLEPNELKALITSVRQVEQALGDGVKRPSVRELQNLTAIRGSLVANTKIEAGELFNEKNITVKRPGDGLSPMMALELLGKMSGQSFNEEDLIKND